MSSSGKIVNLVNPTDGQDAATRSYVDTGVANATAATRSYVDTSIPIGGIIMWSGAFTLPSNWKLCDGNNGTPDLRGRFVLSSGKGSGLTDRYVGQAGGAETVALTEAQMPSHSHGVSARTGGSDGVAKDGGHTHTIKDDGHAHTTSSVSTTVTAYGPLGLARGDYANVPVASYNASGTWNPFSASTSVTVDSKTTGISINTTDSAHNHTITVSETAKGSGNAHENMPPFYVLAFVMRIS